MIGVRFLKSGLILAAILQFISLPLRSQVQKRPIALSGQEIAKKTLPSVVVLVSTSKGGEAQSLGSGFIVLPNVIATNYHLVGNAARIRAKVVGGNELIDIVEVLDYDETKDLALLKAVQIKAQALVLEDKRKIQVGDSIYAVGNPEGLEGTFSQGIVSGIRGLDLIQITAPISPGSSGGPLLSSEGKVVGVTLGRIEGRQNLNFAVPVSHLELLIARVKSPNFIARKRIATDSADQAEGDPAWKSARSLFDLGLDYFVKDRYSDAIEPFEKAVQLEPVFEDAQYFLGWMYYLAGRYDEAIGPLETAVKLAPDEFGKGSHCFLLADTYTKLGRYQESIELYKLASRLQSIFPEGPYQLGELLAKLERHREAIEAYKEAIRRASYFAKAYYGLGLSYLKLGDKYSAFETYESLKSLDENLANRLLFLIKL
jgi:TolA-binding protein